MNEGKELIKALDDIEKEKGISKDILLEAIENSLVAACKNEYGKADNIRVTMNRETGEVKVFADKTVVEEVEDPEMEISVADARLKNKFYDPGDIVHVEIVPKNFGRIAAQKAKQVYGVEIIPQAIDDARNNARINGITNAEFYVGKSEEILPQKYRDEGAFADVIVVDPPRKGCDEALLSTILQIAPKRVVYVSCDSATLARDLKFLCSQGYKLERCRAVDQFPMSVHVETVVGLQRKDT